MDTRGNQGFDGWFLRLPKDVQHQHIQAEKNRQKRLKRQLARMGHKSRRRILQGVYLFLGVTFLGYGFHGEQLLVAGLLGLAVGWSWQLAGMGQILSPLLAGPVFLSWQVHSFYFGDAPLVAILQIICGTVFVAGASFWLGMRQEQAAFES